MTPRLVIAAVLLFVGVVMGLAGRQAAPTPPAPPPSGDIVLVGKFAGPTAAADAAVTAGMFLELADEIAYDTSRVGGPHMTTGVQFDELRTRAFEMRCKGHKVGDRQPRVRDAVREYMTAKVGVSGGPVDEKQREAWEKALRAIGEAAADAAR